MGKWQKSHLCIESCYFLGSTQLPTREGRKLAYLQDPTCRQDNISFSQEEEAGNVIALSKCNRGQAIILRKLHLKLRNTKTVQD
jgi:hypothetical protein